MAHLPVQAAEDSLAARPSALLEVAESIAHHRDLGELFHDLGARLHRVAHFDFLNLLLYDSERQVMRLHILESQQPTSIQRGRESPLGQTPAGRVFETQQPYVVDDIDTETSFPALMETLRGENLRSFCVVPLTTAQRRLGCLGFGKTEPYHYTSSEVEFMQQIARQVAVAVDNALNFQSAQAYQQQLARERDRLRVLLEVNNAVVSKLALHDLLNAISASLRRVIHHEYTSLALFDPATNQMRMLALDFPQGKGLIREEMIVPLDGSMTGQAFRMPQPLVLDRAAMEEFDS